MWKKLVLALAGLLGAFVLVLYLLSLSMRRRWPPLNCVSMNGITTIDDAVEACRKTSLHDWDLVAYAQHLVARKFTYSRLNMS